MEPGNPVVGGTVLRIPAIQSPDFVHDASGWFIGQDGSAEFDNVTVRGDFTSTDGAGTSVELRDGQVILQGPGADSPGAVAALFPGGVIQVTSGLHPGTDQAAIIQLLSHADGGEGTPLLLLANGTVITATDPVNGGPETWHPITLDAGWSVVAGHAAPQYRLKADGDVEFAGAVSRTSFTATTAINSGSPLAAPYVPGHAKVYRGSNVPDGSAPVELDSTGVLRARASASAASTIAEIDGSCSLL